MPPAGREPHKRVGPKRTKRYRQRSAVERMRWGRMRNTLLAVRGRFCERCKRPQTPDDRLQVHHRWPVSEGGPEFPPVEDLDHPERGLVVLCRQCHRREHMPAQERAWSDLLEERWGGNLV